MHRDPRRPNVTLALLWEEYRAATTDGFGYSWYCDLYREWAGRLKPTLPQVHLAGERLFVDFAGHTMEVIDAASGEIHRAEIFVAVLGASSFIYAEATASQTLPDWIAAHVNALSAIGGVPQQIVSDNLKAGITKACFYEPTVNRTYADMAAHYRTAIIPARPYKPPDKHAPAKAGGQGRGRRAGGAALDPGAATQSALLLAGRVEPGDPRTGGSTERPADARLGQHTARAVRTTRSSGAAIAATNALRIRRLEALPGEHRLPHRGRQAFLSGMMPSVPFSCATDLAYDELIQDRGIGSTEVGRPLLSLSCELVLLSGRPCDQPGCAASANP